MKRRVRDVDWSQTPLGAMGEWPHSLRAAVGICLNSKLPMFVWWGPSLINIYNDAYAAVLGKRHPDALGRPAREIWTDVWPTVAEDVDGVMLRGIPVVRERVHLVLERNGYPEDTYLTYSYSPIPDDEGGVGGLFQVCSDETARVRAEREHDRLAEQRQLALDAARMGWWHFDPVTRVSTFDRRYTEIFHVSGDTLPNDVILRRIHPDDLESVWKKVEAALDPVTPSAYFAQHRLVLDDGTIRWVEAYGIATFEGNGSDRHAKSFVGTVADITDRVHGEERARTILESISDAFYAFDVDWRFTYVNRHAQEVLRRTPDELMGRVFWDEFPNAIGSDFEPIYRRAMTEGVAGSITAYYPSHGCWYEAHAYPAAGGGVSVYFRDVTERIRGDQALREHSALLRGISDTTGDVIFAKSRDGSMRLANPAALALIGKPLDQVLGKTDAEFLEDKNAARAVMENDRQVMDSGRPADMEEVIPLADGTERIWLSRKMPNRDAEGNVVGLLGVARDITEQKRAWERINRLYEVAAALSEAVTPEEVARVTVHQGLAAVGASAGSLAFVTDNGTYLEMAEWVGFTPDAIARWQRFPVDAPIPLAEAVRLGAPVYTESAEARLADYPALAPLHTLRRTQSSACLPLTIGGRTVGALGLSFERSGAFSPADREFMMSLARQCAQALERARLFASEQRARTEAERASQMKDDFLATVSHELRTPLNAILGWATILATGTPDGADLRKGLATIERNARAQTKIIEDLLDMSRIVSGKVQLEVQRTDLALVVQAAIDTTRPAAEAKGVRIRSVFDPLAGPINGDPARLQQVFWNLLSNAVKFTPRGGQVQVVLARVSAHVEVTVADTGEGISTDFLPHVFDRFRQADAGTTRRHGGLGIGLAIVKQLVELHGGTVRVQSAGVGQGSVFTVEIPLSVLHSQPETGSRERRHLTAVAGPWADQEDHVRLAGVRVLVVDDEPDARALVKRLLDDSGASTRMASSADEGMDMIAKERPDLVISDIGMPGEDGYAFIRRLRALGAADGGDVPALALTAYARAEDRVRAMRAGFQTHVVKPVEANELITVIASLVGRIVQ